MSTEKRISWKDSNLALIGSKLDHDIKAEAAELEEAWQGIDAPEAKIRVWRIEKFQVKEWPEELYGKFHKGDSYIVLNTYKKPNSDGFLHDIHIWIGSESSQDEYGTAAYKMVEADEYLGGIPVEHRQVQGHEDDTFLSYFPVLEYLDGGIESGFRHVEPDPEHPVLYLVKGTKNKMTLTQVPLTKNSLNEGDSFILYGGKANVWCWHGKKAHPLEKANSNSWAEKMCTMGTVVTLDQDQGDEEEDGFWNLVGRDGTIGPDMEDDEEVTEFQPKLYRVDGDWSKDLELVATADNVVSKPSKGSKQSCFERALLKEEDVFLMDSGWEIFVWIGKGSDRKEKIAAMAAADKYTKQEEQASLRKTSELPVHIVKQGYESDLFNSYFA